LALQHTLAAVISAALFAVNNTPFDKHMKDREIQSDDWIGEWIARQRETLARNPQGAAPETQPFADPFNVGSALLGAWASAGLFQSAQAQQTSDLFARLPPIGLAREQTEAWRELAAAQARCQQIENELRAVLLKVQHDALDLLSERVRQRGDADPIDSFRTLYDLWVECGEQVYGKLAHSDSYSKLQAELGNATMRLRARMQTVIEHGLKQFDLPTRSELNSLHRQVRELRGQLEQAASAEVRPDKTRPAKARVKRKPQPKRSTKARRR
jgi:hypothetical protein